MFIPKKEHDGNRVIQLIHFVEIRHLVDIAQVHHSKVLDLVGDAVENLVLAHAVGIPVATETDYHETVVFGHDGLVDVPAGFEVREDDGAHGG